MATAPLPVPTSAISSGGMPGGRGAATNMPEMRASAMSTSISVSGRGMSARGSMAKA